MGRDILTKEGERELLATRERAEAGDSSVFEIVAQLHLKIHLNGTRGHLATALRMYDLHDDTFSRRARKPVRFEGEFRLPMIVNDDMQESLYPGRENKESVEGAEAVKFF